MKPSLCILYLEDSASDFAWVQQLLIQGGLSCDLIHVETREEFMAALNPGGIDLVLADCALPQFDGFQALNIVRRQAPQLPFIFISGTIGEETAVEYLRSGATDYILKDRLARLVPAIRRALEEAAERKQRLEVERRLKQAQRLEAVGTLAGGVAHDFNNILAIITGHAALLGQGGQSPQQVGEIAATLQRTAQRGKELVIQLLTFAQKSDSHFTRIDLNKCLLEAIEMMREALPRDIHVDLQLGENLPSIQADPGQMNRVLINLLTNARDAMPQGGHLTLASSLVRADQVSPHASAMDEGYYLAVRVTDTGTGMDEATRQHIFEPFFTTKPRGKGTGLGMAVVYGLMQSHNGIVDVQSELGKGTTLSLFFPVSDVVSEKAPKPAAPVRSAISGREMILLVDDEPEVRYFLKIIFESYGYTVCLAGTAEEALEIFEKHPHEILLLFSDIGLPKLDGFGLCSQAKKLNPNLKTVLASGYAHGSFKTRLAELGINGFILKPYDIYDMLAIVRTVLDKGHAN